VCIVLKDKPSRVALRKMLGVEYVMACCNEIGGHSYVLRNDETDWEKHADYEE